MSLIKRNTEHKHQLPPAHERRYVYQVHINFIELLGAKNIQVFMLLKKEKPLDAANFVSFPKKCQLKQTFIHELGTLQKDLQQKFSHKPKISYFSFQFEELNDP